MKTFALTIALIAMTAGAAFAGGPVIVGGEPVVVVDPPKAGSVASGPIVGIIGGLALICLIACSGNASTAATGTTDPVEF